MTVNDNPVANITPEPAEACILTDIQLNGNPTGGNVPFTHLWTGAGSPYLSSTAIVNPIFNHNQLGPYEVTYTVTDVNGCIGSDVLTINPVSYTHLDVYKRQKSVYALLCFLSQ